MITYRLRMWSNWRAIASAAVISIIGVAGLCPSASESAQSPTFRSEIAIVRLDVTVIGDDGYPIADLSTDEFEVTINGKPSKVLSRQYVGYWQDPVTPAKGSYSSNMAPGGRLTVVVVDEMNLVSGQERALMTGLQEYFRHIRPGDHTALISLPGKSARVDFTNDVKLLQDAVTRLHAWPASAPDLTRLALDQGEPGPPQVGNPAKIGQDDLNPVVDTLTAIADTLKDVEGPKNLILITSKLPGKATQLPVYAAFAQHAAAARVNVYAIREEAVPSDVLSSSTNTGITRADFLDGLDLLAGATGGTTISGIARATGAFDRIDRETRGAYVVAVELPSGTNPTKPVEATIHVRRPGVTVRGPKQLVPSLQRGDSRKGAKDQLRLMLNQPRPATEIPLRVTNYTARGAIRPKTIILAEIPKNAFTGPLQWGYEIRAAGRVVAGQMERSDVGSVADEVEAFSIISAADLAAGDYVLRFAIVDADGRRGSVEHRMRVQLTDAGDCELSDVFIGESTAGHFHPRIEMDPRIKEVTATLDLYPKRAVSQLQDTKVRLMLVGNDGERRDGIELKPSVVGTKGVVQAAFRLDTLIEGTYQICARAEKDEQSVGDAVCQSFAVVAGR